MGLVARNGYIPIKKTTQTINQIYTIQPDKPLQTMVFTYDTDEDGYDTAMQGYQAGMAPAAVPTPSTKEGCATNGFEDVGFPIGFIWVGTLNGVYGNHRVPSDAKNINYYDGTGYVYPNPRSSAYLEKIVYSNFLLGDQSYTLPTRTISVDDIIVDPDYYPTTQYAVIRQIADGSDAYVAVNAQYFIAICTCEQVQYYSDAEKTQPTTSETPWYDISITTIRQRYNMRYSYTEIGKTIPSLPKKYKVIEMEV